MNQVSIAMDLAIHYHRGQMYGDKPYTYHLQAVAEKVFQYYPHVKGLELEQLHATAYLHDIIEDTEVNELILHEAGVCSTVIRAVMLLTKKGGEPYNLYIECIKQNEVARIVKLCDTVSNLEHSIKEGRLKNINKYTKQIQLLGGFDVR